MVKDDGEEAIPDEPGHARDLYLPPEAPAERRSGQGPLEAEQPQHLCSAPGTAGDELGATRHLFPGTVPAVLTEPGHARYSSLPLGHEDRHSRRSAGDEPGHARTLSLPRATGDSRERSVEPPGVSARFGFKVCASRRTADSDGSLAIVSGSTGYPNAPYTPPLAVVDDSLVGTAVSTVVDATSAAAVSLTDAVAPAVTTIAASYAGAQIGEMLAEDYVRETLGEWATPIGKRAGKAVGAAAGAAAVSALSRATCSRRRTPSPAPTLSPPPVRPPDRSDRPTTTIIDEIYAYLDHESRDSDTISCRTPTVTH